MAIVSDTPMGHIYLYAYPFDETGTHTLTFAESLAAMHELERQLNAMLKPDWRWCDLLLEIVERHPTYVIYEVTHGDQFIGRAVVMPYCADPPKKHPDSAVQQALYAKIRSRGKPR